MVLCVRFFPTLNRKSYKRTMKTKSGLLEINEVIFIYILLKVDR